MQSAVLDILSQTSFCKTPKNAVLLPVAGIHCAANNFRGFRSTAGVLLMIFFAHFVLEDDVKQGRVPHVCPDVMVIKWNTSIEKKEAKSVKSLAYRKWQILPNG